MMNAKDENIQQETQVDCSTKINEESHKTHLTIDWEGMTPRDLQEIAEGRIVIRFQDEHRRKGEKPSENATLKATDFRVGTRKTRVSMTPEQAVAALSDEQLNAILKARGLL